MEKMVVFQIPSVGLSLQRIIEFVQLNTLFQSEIYLIKNKQRFNAKSITSIVSVVFTSKKEEEFIISVKGQNAEKDINKIIDFFGNNKLRIQ
ncbi:hypothetical protein BKP35_16855 [Anaerobacillus arseniciselenatis]|uniref:HPr domain-containing protein n=1 Tax=Anaerobacillus arseniciselenatis TaxID=85682 RepID=A0A1S2LA25_9BACI|nr:HPr family phosphocarrier protein [Anaerobacillus arseniciselenatis]OIJ09339.1 hypothetical protein BKP35_16855 [Anaerobacillus arseniciselenatis]